MEFDSSVATVNSTSGLISAIKSGTTTIRATSLANPRVSKSFNLKVYKYAATVNNWYDHGYHVRYNETESQSKANINSYTDAVANRYFALFGLAIVDNNTSYFNSAIDICKGTVTSSNIERLCTHSSPIHTERSNVISNFNKTGNNTTTNVFWTGHHITSVTNNIIYDNRSCSSGTKIMMLEISNSSNRTEDSRGVLMHELNHQYGLKDHYHEDNGNGQCVSAPYCVLGSGCNLGGGTNPRPSSCIMFDSRQDISSSTIICTGCKNDMINHLNGHH